MRFFSLSCVVISGLILLSTNASSASNRLFIIPLERMESGLEKLFRQGADLNLVEGLYNMNLKKSQASRLVLKNGQPIPTHDTLSFSKYFETQYYGTINIGNPGRPFKVILDTTWAYSWVPSKDCPVYSMPCALHQKYDHSQSSSYVQDGRPFDISKELSGYMSVDDFQPDGTIGLGLKDLSPMAIPFVDNFAEQNRIMKMFSFYIDRNAKNSFFKIGAIDYRYNTSEFTSVNLTSPYFWQFNMTKVSVVRDELRKDFCANGCSALADTSTNTIIGPVDEIMAINHLIGASKILFSKRYRISCKNIHSGPNVTFSISNKEFHIEPKDYIQELKYLGIPLCISAFQPVDTENFPSNTWGLGGAFLYRYYTAFDIDSRKFMIADI